MCGDDQVSWSTDLHTLRRIRYKLKLAAASPQWTRAFAGVRLDPLLEVIESQLRERADTTGSRLESDFLDVAYHFRHRQAADPRDKVYAILNLVEGRKLKFGGPDYNLSAEESWEMVSKAFRSLNPDLGVTVGT